MKKIVSCTLVFCLMALTVNARDSDEPFQDPSDSNPVESLRRVARMMNRLSKEDLSEQEVKDLQELVQDRLSRTLISIESQQQQDMQGQGSGSSKSKKNNKRRPPPKQGNKRQGMKHTNSGSKNGNKPKGDKPNGKEQGGKQKPGDGKEGQGNGKKVSDQKDKADKADTRKTKNRWGKLPEKERDILEINLERDVPDGYEKDMKDFLKRVKDIK
jgi:hypothetical protein